MTAKFSEVLPFVLVYTAVCQKITPKGKTNIKTPLNKIMSHIGSHQNADENAAWHVLYLNGGTHASVAARARRLVDTYNANATADASKAPDAPVADPGPVELFAPVIAAYTHNDGRVTRRERALTYQYIFVRATTAQIRALCAIHRALVPVMNPDNTHTYAVVADTAMDAFRRIAAAMRNSLPLYDIRDLALEEGDLVEIAEGPFAGLRGIYIPRRASTSGNIVIRATEGLGAVLYDVRARYVRVLRFSPHTRRAYDQTDAILPRLFAALRLHTDHKPLPDNLITHLTVFIRRMENAQIPGDKARARLLAILAAAATVLADDTRAAAFRARLSRLTPAVTSPLTLSLLTLLTATATPSSSSPATPETTTPTLNPPSPTSPTATTSTTTTLAPGTTETTTLAALADALPHLTASTPSRLRTLLLAEYHHYLSLLPSNIE